MQVRASGPGQCDTVHYGRDIYQAALQKAVIEPNLAKMELIKTETAKILASAQEKIASATAHIQV